MIKILSRRSCLVTIACVVGLTATLGAQTDPSKEQKPAPPGTFVDVGGHKLYLHCMGAGGPAVILEAGGGDNSTRWVQVQGIISKRFKTCAYDRAGSGLSEPGPGPRTMRQEVFELHALLESAKIAPPYILVGHSYGGLLVRLYTAEYPKDVIGLVLVDPTHENTRLYLQRRGEAQGKWVRVREGAKDRAIPPVQATLSKSPSPPADNFWAEELQQMYEARKKTPEPLGDRPLIVLAGGKPSTRPADTPPDLWNEIHKEKADQKAELARLSRNGKLVRDPSSGHHIHVDNPELVARSIEEVIQAASQGKKLSP
jgi:pimeloyl-ACP methyl ester carboxylesterase